MHLQLAEGFLGLTSAQVALLIAGIAVVFALRRWRQVAARQRSIGARNIRGYNEMEQRPASSASATGNSLNVREVATELSALLADLEETARRVASQIENRRAVLEILLKEADEKIRRLESLARAPGSAEPRNTAVIGTAHDAAQTLSRLRQERGAPVPSDDPAYQPIYQLADRGKTARDIAQELGRQPGEVELILALRGRQRVG